jgi:hypothetical protein
MDSATKKAGWPKSHPVHSPENRTGQAWRSGSVQIIVEDYDGAKLICLPSGHYQCRYCLNIIRIDERAVAACENCGYIYNDGGLEKSKMSNREKKISRNAFRAGCQRKS